MKKFEVEPGMNSAMTFMICALLLTRTHVKTIEKILQWNILLSCMACDFYKVGITLLARSCFQIEHCNASLALKLADITGIPIVSSVERKLRLNEVSKLPSPLSRRNMQEGYWRGIYALLLWNVFLANKEKKSVGDWRSIPKFEWWTLWDHF